MVVGVLVGVGLVGVVVAVWLTRPRADITQEVADAIEFGMDERQVAERVGGEAGDYRTGEVGYSGVYVRSIIACGPEPAAVRTTTRQWHTDTGLLEVSFDQFGRAMSVDFSAASERSFDPRQLIRRLLHLP